MPKRRATSANLDKLLQDSIVKPSKDSSNKNKHVHFVHDLHIDNATSSCKESRQAGCLESDGVHPMEQNSDSLCIREPLSPNEHISSPIQNEASGLAKETQLQENRICVNDNGQHVPSKRLKQRANDGQMKQCQPGFLRNYQNICKKKNNVDEAISSAENQVEREKCEHLDKVTLFYSSEEMAVAARTSNLSSSQMMLDQDSQGPDLMGDVSCIKCNKGDQLLICCDNTCPIAVHENCLGSAAVFDGLGNFYCPPCSYKQAYTAYLELKKKFICAKENAELSRDRLRKFMNMEYVNEQKVPSELPSVGKLNQSRLVENGNPRDGINSNGKEEGTGNGQVFVAQLHQQEPEVAYIFGNSVQQGPCSSPVSDKSFTPNTNKIPKNHVHDHVDGGVVEIQGQQEPSSVQYCDNLYKGEKTNISEKASDVSDLQEEPVNAPGESSTSLTAIGNLPRVGIETILTGKAHSVEERDADLQQQPVNTPPSPVLDVSMNSPCLGKDTLLNSEEQADVGGTNADLQQKHDNIPEGSCNSVCIKTVLTNQGPAYVGAASADEQQKHLSSPPRRRPSQPLDETVEEISENDDVDEGYELKRRQMPVIRSYCQSPHRRKKTPWTSEEEEILKEGVLKYANADAKVVPWRKILEFGRDTFLVSRTTVDLKDKWRNICTKGGP